MREGEREGEGGREKDEGGRAREGEGVVLRMIQVS